MKPARIALTALLAAGLAGCGTVNTTSTRNRPADTAVDAKTRVNDLLQQIFLTAKEVRMSRTKGGPYEVQVDVENNGFEYRSFAYRFDWVDAAGNVLASQTSVWKSTNVPAGGATVIRAVAPTDDAADFRLQIRRADT
ncbi:MAG: YcfL family protein [Planctomycetota bacterium]